MYPSDRGWICAGCHATLNPPSPPPQSDTELREAVRVLGAECWLRRNPGRAHWPSEQEQRANALHKAIAATDSNPIATAALAAAGKEGGK